MRQKSRRRNSGEDVKNMIELEIELEIELKNGPMNVLLIVPEIVLEIAFDIDQEFESHFYGAPSWTKSMPKIRIRCFDNWCL